MMRQEFVEFFSPGSFTSEVTRKPIDARSVDLACRMATEITERHGATPYGFRFVARERADDELDAKDVDRGPMHYLGGEVETLEQVKARATDKDRILIANMEGNGYDRVITNRNSWMITLPLRADDVVLDWPRAVGGAS